MACAFLIAAVAPVFAGASGPILPQHVNTSQANILLTISENGLATVTIQCIGLSTCTGIDAEIYLKRKVGNSWVRVELGNATDTWTVSSSTKFLIKSFTHTVTEKGDYRTTVNYTFTKQHKPNISLSIQHALNKISFLLNINRIGIKSIMTTFMATPLP